MSTIDPNSNLAEFLYKAHDDEFAAWLHDPQRFIIDEADIAKLRTMAETVDDQQEGLRFLARLLQIPEVLTDFLCNASDDAFAAWLHNRQRAKLDQADVADLKTVAEALNDKQDGLRLLARLLQCPEVHSEPLSRGLLFRGEANIYHALERYEESIQAAEKAIEIYRNGDYALEVARASVIKVSALGAIGHYTEAITLARHIRPHFVRRRRELAHLALARAIAHTLAWRLKAALADYRLALRHFSALPNSTLRIGLTKLNMGVLGNQMDRLDEAESWLWEAFAIFQEAEHTFNLVKTRLGLAQNCVRRGQYQAALDHLSEARTALQDSPDSPDRGFIDLDSAVVHLRLNHPNEAESLAREALGRFEGLKRDLDSAEALLLLARILARSNAAAKTKEAFSLFQRAEDTLQHYQMPTFVAWVQLEHSELLLQRNRSTDAIRKAETALPVFVQEKLPLLQGQAHLVLGDACWSWAPAEAEQHYRTALTISRDQDALLFARAWRGLGRLAVAEGQWRKAESAFGHALHALEGLRRALRTHAYQASFLEDKRSLAMSLLAAVSKTSNKRKGATRLLGWLERWKAAALADLLAEQPLDRELDAATETLLKEREQLLIQLTELHDAESSVGDGPKLSLQRARSLRAESQNRIQEKAVVRRQLQLVEDKLVQQQAPSIAWRQGAVIDTQRVQQLLDPDTLLISYYVAAADATLRNNTPAQLYALTLTNQPGDLQIHDLNCSYAEVEDMWEHTFGSMERHVQGDEDLLDVQGRLGYLHTMLLHPFLSRLKGKRRLLILPERGLANIPFAALYDEQSTCYLVEQAVVQMAPSATVLSTCRSRPTGSLPPLLLGYPNQPGTAKYLPGVRPEIEAIAALCDGATTFLEKEATREAFWAESKDRSVIHFASHANFNSKYPLEAVIELAGESHLYASELYLHFGKLAGSTVILSGCLAGQGRAAGNDLLGLPSAFLYAGAVGVIAGLWKVDDEATKTLMIEFYRAWNTGKADAAGALQIAQQQFLADQRYQSPYLWSPFVLTGDSRYFPGKRP